ncbi:hypothetical protein PIB30_039692 [Stylosanthes scabra]|uniref:Uncharacterized protein n=1 Tax=Stylosanthes scabra TaxID=79078 RepID=A0ABU6XEJ4_9FABA|nr:hypothetical protein [Stylosanthes scabra]
MVRGDQGEAAGRGRRPPAAQGRGRAVRRDQRQPALRSPDINRLSREVHVVGAQDFQSSGGPRHTPSIFRGGEATITLQDVAYHFGLRTDDVLVGDCVRDFQFWYGQPT